jgi:selenocysteine lyase/cysteine desulfurase
MSHVSRRDFIAASLATGVSATGSNGDSIQAPGAPAARSDDDPLGVRGDFPIVRARTYLNSAYITPVPTQVVAAGRAFVERKAERPISLGEMLRTTDEVRARGREHRGQRP